MNHMMTRRAFPRIMAGTALTILPLLTAAGQSGNGAVTLRMKFKQGDVTKYQTNMSVTMAGPGGAASPTGKGAGVPLQQFSVIQQFKTNKLLPSGGAEVLVTTVNMQGAGGIGGAPLPKPVLLIMDSRGGVSASKSAQGGAAANMMGNMMGANPLGLQQVPLPEKPVKPGDSWTNNLTLPGMGTGSVKGQFVKYQSVGKHKTALLHFVVTMPIKMMMDTAMQPTTSPAAAQMSMAGTMLMNVDNDIAASDGKLIRSSGNGTMLITLTNKSAASAIPPKTGPNSKAVKPGSMTVNTRITMGTTMVE